MTSREPGTQSPPVRWCVKAAPEDEVKALASRLMVTPLVARLLWLRGLKEREAASTFLQPKLTDLVSPAALPDMGIAAARIARAVRENERIAICGDYDVDGMTGTALLVRFLRIAGADVTYAIPDRTSDGYGLSVAGVDRLAAKGVRVAVTVDNGVSAFAALERARELAIDVVVTDHHLPGPTLPPALAIVDPLRTDVTGHPASSLCGCGLAFKLAWGVAEVLQRTKRDERLREFLRDAVGLVALATIADVVPLVGENRVLVASGLAALRGSRHPGIRALLDVAGIGTSPLTTDDVIWKLAPRLNAAGRMNTPEHAIDLFTTDDASTAYALAEELEAANEQRRAIEKGVVAQAMAMADARLASATDERHSLVVAGEGWHRGVIGIVAARLVDAHARPSIVIGLEADGGRGSCRTTGGVNLFEALSKCGPHLRRYGGHAAAAGLEVEREAIPAFSEAFEEAVRAQVGDAPPESTLSLDGEATLDDITMDTVEQMRKLAPFGAGNPVPKFAIRNAMVAGRPKLMGATSDHLSFAAKTTAGAIRVVAFRQAGSYDLVASGAPLDIAATPTVNEWRGTRTAELQAIEIRPASRSL